MSVPSKAEGMGAVMHMVAALCAIAVPLLLFFKPISDLDGNAWEAYQRTDVLVLIFCTLAALLIGASLVSQRRSLLVAGAGLLFASFGLLIPGPFEAAAQNDEVGIGIGAYLSIGAALVGAAAAALAAELASTADAVAPVGAGRGVAKTGPIGGAAGPPAAQGPLQSPAGGAIAPGWYDDPHRKARLRYFDGRAWTEQTSN